MRRSPQKTFLHQRAKGATVLQAAKEVGVSKVIGYAWLERWNKQGMEGLKPNYGGEDLLS